MTRIARVEDAATFAQGASSLSPYEALFGYVNETFAVEVHEGDVRQVDNGRFNMTNPVSLVYPQLSGARPFERLAIDQRDALDVFVNRGQPPWPRPAAQDALVLLSMATLLATVGILIRHAAVRAL